MTHTIGEPESRCTCHREGLLVRLDSSNGVTWIHVEDETPAKVFHWHETNNSLDFDGEYVRRYTVRPVVSQDEYDFWSARLGAIVSSHASATLKVTYDDEKGEAEIEYYQETEEGYSHTEGRLCFDPHCSHDASSQRDFRAESMGY